MTMVCWQNYCGGRILSFVNLGTKPGRSPLYGGFALSRRRISGSLTMMTNCCRKPSRVFEAYFAEFPEADVVAGNYLEDLAGVRTRGLKQNTLFELDHTMALMKEQWLPSGSAMYKTNNVDYTFFDSPYRHLEWTVSALLLSLTKNIKRVSD